MQYFFSFWSHYYIIIILMSYTYFETVLNDFVSKLVVMQNIFLLLSKAL